MHNRRVPRLCTGLLVAALGSSLAISPVLSPLAAHAATSSDLQAQLDAARKRLGDLQKTVDQSYAELGRTQYNLSETQRKIAEVEAQIEQNKADLVVAREELSGTASSSYKSSKADLLTLVLSSQSFDELLTRAVYANKIAEAQAAAIDRVNTLQAELEGNETELKKQEAEQRELVASREKETAAAEAAAAEQSSYIDQLSDEVKQKLEEERIAAAEAARLEAEQALQQEQQQNANRPNPPANNQTPSTGGSSSSGNAGGNNGSTSTGGGSNATDSQRDIAVAAAMSQVGKPYGHSNNGSNWDCNGLTHYAWAQAGVSIPYASGNYSYGQFQWMKKSGRWVTSASQLRKGDLVFYSYDGGATTYHVALYIGGGQVVHANGYLWGVHTSSINFDYGFCGGGSPI